ncbi:MAG: efflux RND transporter periplasmic adaptor subunit [Tannerellaceae bacterium]|nr:efflux RND transporter periplasmic adaptor subunit [Tannerellaceae bacterium]
MKKYIIALITLTVLATGCHSGHHHDSHDHEHEGHDHTHGDGHVHGTSAASAGGEHVDEIVFTHEQAEAIGLEVEIVQPRTFHQVIKTSGQVQNQPGDEVILAATADGIVTFSNSSLTEGASVQKGETVVTISARNLPEGEQTSRIRVEFENAQSEYQRAQNLVEDKIISAREFEQIRSRYETARIAYEAQAGSVSDRGIIVQAPIGGFIKNRVVEEGEYVTVGQPVVTITRTRSLQLRAEVPEKYYAALRNIQTAHFRTGYDSTLYKLSDLNGRLLSYGKTAGNESYYIPVTFEFNNVGDLLPGSFTEIWLIAAPQPHRLTVPVSSLSEEQGLYFVYLQTGEEEYKKQEVITGSNDGERVEILSGITTGDRVVTRGVIQVKLAANAGLIPEGHTH